MAEAVCVRTENVLVRQKLKQVMVQALVLAKSLNCFQEVFALISWW